MVKYIRLKDESNNGKIAKKSEANKDKSSIKMYAAIGAAVLVIGGTSLEYLRNTDYWKPRIHTVCSINSPESLEFRLNQIVDDIREYPEFADRMAYRGIKIVMDAGAEFSHQTDMEMFNAVKQKIEQKPELLDYLGFDALKYQETRMLRTYKNKMKNAYHGLKEKAINAKDKVKEMFAD